MTPRPFQRRIASYLFFILVPACMSTPRVWGAASSEEIHTLDPVVVTATRSQEEVSRIPASVTIMTQEEISQSNATHAGDLIKEVEGIWVANTSGSTPSGILIDARGFNNGGGNGGRMLVLIDGRRANLVDTSSPDWADIPIESIDRIEVVRGSNSALYGDNAVAGVINIITKQGAGTPGGSLSLERGSYDFWKRKGTLSGSEGRLSYFIYGGYESAEGYRENSDYHASNYVGNFGYQINPSSTIHLRTGYLSNKRLLPGSLTEADIAAVGRRGSVTPGDRAATHQFRFDLGFDTHIDQAQWVELTVGQTLRGQGSMSTTPGVGTFELDDDSRSTALTGKYRVTRSVAGRKSQLILGVDLLKENVQSKSFSNFPDPSFPFIQRQMSDYERRLMGVYANEEIAIHPVWLLTVAGRMDWSEFTSSQAVNDLVSETQSNSPSNDRSFRVFSPKVGLTYLVTPAASLFASSSRSFRFPNRDELTGFFGLTPELDPERATVYEVGSNFQAGRQFEGHLSLFRMNVKNEILFVPPPIGAPTFGKNENVPEVQHEGVEASGAVRLAEAVRLRGGYTFTRTEIKEGPFAGSALPITPKHVGSAGVDFGRGRGWIFSLNGRFVGRRILANDLENTREKLPGYAIFDTRLVHSTDMFELFFGINNLLNKEYEEFGSIGGFPFGSRVAVYPSPERNYIGGATVRF
jgi:iron complex outermembrane receptor protein